MHSQNKPPLFLALDLEMEQPSDEILSVGICLFDEYQLEESKNFYITPTEPVSEFIQNLTGIKDTDFDFTKSRTVCYAEMSSWVQEQIDRYVGRKYFREAVTWGTGDVPLLRADMRKHCTNFEWLSQRFTDTKTLYLFDKYTSGKSLASKTSLNTAMASFGIVPTGTAHNSMYDAINTAKVFRTIICNQSEVKHRIKQLSTIV